MAESSTQSTLGQTDHGLTGSQSTGTTMVGMGDGKFDRFQSPASAFPTSRSEGWEEAYDRQKRERWAEKVEGDLRGWRGGNG